MFLRNVGTNLQVHTTSQPRRQPSTSSYADLYPVVICFDSVVELKCVLFVFSYGETNRGLTSETVVVVCVVKLLLGCAGCRAYNRMVLRSFRTA
jgi:hypothetical protein